MCYRAAPTLPQGPLPTSIDFFPVPWYYGIVPAVSQKQQQAMAIAEHEPDKLHKSNMAMLKMSHKQLHEFASTMRSKLPKKKSALKTAAKKVSK